MNIDIKVEGMSQLIESFSKVERGIVDLRQLGTWDWVQNEFYKITREIFASEGGAGKGGKWKPLSSPYAAIKASKYGAQPILQASGKLYRSMTSSGGDAVVEKKAQEMTLGSTVPYGKFHQSGGGRLPRRAVEFTAEQEKRLVEPINKKLKQLIANAKLRDARGY